MKSELGLFFIIFLSLAVLSCFALSLFCYHFPQQYRGLILKNSAENSIEPSLVASVIKAESNYHKNVKSTAGAIGLMQLMPSTANWILEKNNLRIKNPDFYDPEINIKLGCIYLKMLFERFKVIENVLCAYNAGPNKANEWLSNPNYSQNGVITAPPYSETADYVKKVLFYKKFYNLVW